MPAPAGESDPAGRRRRRPRRGSRRPRHGRPDGDGAADATRPAAGAAAAGGRDGRGAGRRQAVGPQAAGRRGAAAAPAGRPAQPRRGGRGANRRPSGRERHDEKITVYVSAEELMDLEHARLVLRGEHGLAVDRGRIVREAVAVVLADLESRGRREHPRTTAARALTVRRA